MTSTSRTKKEKKSTGQGNSKYAYQSQNSLLERMFASSIKKTKILKQQNYNSRSLTVNTTSLKRLRSHGSSSQVKLPRQWKNQLTTINRMKNRQIKTNRWHLRMKRINRLLSQQSMKEMKPKWFRSKWRSCVWQKKDPIRNIHRIQVSQYIRQVLCLQAS